MTTSQAYASALGGIILIPQHTSEWQAILAEAFATFLLIFVILEVAVGQRGAREGPIAVGMTVAANIYAM